MIVVPETEVRLLNNVPLLNTYEHQLTFGSELEQQTYFIGKSTLANKFTDFTYVRQDGSILVPKARDKLYSTNYLMFKNTDFSSKWFYAFITKLEYINPDTTKVHFEMDVFQTWQFDFTFRSSYIEREHTKRWNDDGSPVINTIDEGLDYGSEYETVNVTQHQPYEGIYFLIIVATERMDSAGEGIKPVLNGAPQPLTFYIHPFRKDGTSPPFTISGMEINLSPIRDVLTSLYTQTTAVNNIAALYVTEYFGMNIPQVDGVLQLLDMTALEHVTIQDENSSFNTLRLRNMPVYQERTINAGDKYAGYFTHTESKLLMHPYTVTVLSDMKGNQQEIKNEHIKSNDVELLTRGSLGTSNKISYNVKRYLMEEGRFPLASEVAISSGIINNSPNDVPIISDMLSAYLQGNRNQLENQKNSIIYGGVANTVGNLFGGIGSAIAGNPVGAVSAGASMLTGYANAYFQIEGLQAKKKDLDTMPAQINKLGGNTAFDYGNDLRGVYVIKKQITTEYRNRLGDFFKMYGYKVNKLKKPVLRTREHFNFIKTVGANLTGNVPQDDLVIIKKMFDNGVTLWHGDYVGNYDLENNEI